MQPGAALADVSNTASRVPPAETPPKTGAGQPDAAAGATQVQQDTCTAAEKQDDTTPNSAKDNAGAKVALTLYMHMVQFLALCRGRSHR